MKVYSGTHVKKEKCKRAAASGVKNRTDSLPFRKTNKGRGGEN